MEVVLLLSIILVTTAIITATVFFVLTLIQIRQTAKEIQVLAERFDTVSPLLDFIVLGGSLFSLIAGKMKDIINR